MRKIRLDLEYDGTAYHGWQVQPDVATVQQELENVLHRILRERVRVVGAGRTDAGVHALGQVGHFQTEGTLDAQALLRGMNSLLPEDIVVNAVRETSPLFHARKSALLKRYEYWILNDPAPSAFHHPFLWQVRGHLETGSMQRAADLLAGEHDFASFQASGGEPGKDTIRNVRLLEVTGFRNRLIRIAAEGNSFLRGMARILVGTLVDVGAGRIPDQAVREILLAKDRRAAGRTAPAKGLFLAWVRYPDTFEIATCESGRPGRGPLSGDGDLTWPASFDKRGGRQ